MTSFYFSSSQNLVKRFECPFKFFSHICFSLQIKYALLPIRFERFLHGEGNNFPAKTPKEFLAILKSSPGKYSFATSGVGTVQHLGFEMLKGASGSFVVHIPYRGAAQIMPDVISGQVPIAVISATAALAQAKAGKLQAIALMSQAKLAGAENIPPLADALPGFDAAPLLFVLAPSGTPAPVVEKLNDAIRQVMRAPEMPQAAALQGAVPAYMPSGQLATAMVAESASWRKIVKEQKISVE